MAASAAPVAGVASWKDHTAGLTGLMVSGWGLAMSLSCSRPRLKSLPAYSTAPIGWPCSSCTSPNSSLPAGAGQARWQWQVWSSEVRCSPSRLSEVSCYGSRLLGECLPPRQRWLLASGPSGQRLVHKQRPCAPLPARVGLASRRIAR